MINVLGPLYFGLPGNENLTIIFQFNHEAPFKAMHLVHLCSRFLILSKLKAFSWSPKYSDNTPEIVLKLIWKKKVSKRKQKHINYPIFKELSIFTA